MAYKTSHRLTPIYYADFKKHLQENLWQEIHEYIEDNEDICWVISEGVNEWGEDDRSFTDKDLNMQKLSEEFPYLIFTLEYEPIDDYSLGEYKEYWLNGKVQRECIQISVDEFDSSKLREVE